MEGVTRSRH